MAPLAQRSVVKEDVTPDHAWILQAYYALRTCVEAKHIGTQEILAWLRKHLPPQHHRPSGSLVRFVLLRAKLPHRKAGRPSTPSKALVKQLQHATPFLSARVSQPRA